MLAAHAGLFLLLVLGLQPPAVSESAVMQVYLIDPPRKPPPRPEREIPSAAPRSSVPVLARPADAPGPAVARSPRQRASLRRTRTATPGSRGALSRYFAPTYVLIRSNR